MKSPLKQTKLEPATLGLDGVTLAAERTSSTFALQGVSNLAVFVKHTYSAATRIDVNLDLTPDGLDGIGSVTNWYKSQSVSISSGTATLSELDTQKATGGASGNYEIRFSDLNAAYGRLRISSTSGDASDIAVVTAIRAQAS